MRVEVGLHAFLSSSRQAVSITLRPFCVLRSIIVGTLYRRLCSLRYVQRFPIFHCATTDPWAHKIPHIKGSRVFTCSKSNRGVKLTTMHHLSRGYVCVCLYVDTLFSLCTYCLHSSYSFSTLLLLLLLLLLLSSLLSPICRVFTSMYRTQTMFLGHILLQLFCIYNFCYM
jgi:hypothetical protein